jgi:hypothetical protein
MELLDLAAQEMLGFFIWKYLDPFDRLDDDSVEDVQEEGQEGIVPGQMAGEAQANAHGITGQVSAESLAIPQEAVTTGAIIEVFYNQNLWKIDWRFAKSPKKIKEGTPWDVDLLQLLFDLQEQVKEWVSPLIIRTEHKRGDYTFRGSPIFRRSNRHWNDWAEFDYGPSYRKTPAEIWCFVDLNDLPPNISMRLQGERVGKGVFAVVETAHEVEDLEDLGSDIITRHRKDCQLRTEKGAVLRRKFYLADVEAIVGPAVVIPDIGSEDDTFLQVSARSEWANCFAEWLKTTHAEDAEEIKDTSDKEESSISEEDERTLAEGHFLL